MHEGLTAREREGNGNIPPHERKVYAESLKQVIQAISAEINVSLDGLLENNTGSVPLVSEDGSLAMQAYAKKRGGPYAKTKPKERREDEETSVAEDEDLVLSRKKEWGDENNLEAWEARQKERYGFLWEMLLFTLLHKALKKHCLVVRATEYDDYVNGVDLLIFDKQTGELLCAFDEVVNSTTGFEYRKKMARANRRSESGFRVKYGLSRSTQGFLMRSRVDGIEGVPLNITKEDLEKLLREQSFSSETLTPFELEMLDKTLTNASRSNSAGVGSIYAMFATSGYFNAEVGG